MMDALGSEIIWPFIFICKKSYPTTLGESIIWIWYTLLVSPLLARLTKAPLKPQQRIFALKAGALPSLLPHGAWENQHQ